MKRALINHPTQLRYTFYGSNFLPQGYMQFLTMNTTKQLKEKLRREKELEGDLKLFGSEILAFLSCLLFGPIALFPITFFLYTWRGGPEGFLYAIPISVIFYSGIWVYEKKSLKRKLDKLWSP